MLAIQSKFPGGQMHVWRQGLVTNSPWQQVHKYQMKMLMVGHQTKQCTLGISLAVIKYPKYTHLCFSSDHVIKKNLTLVRNKFHNTSYDMCQNLHPFTNYVTQTNPLYGDSLIPLPNFICEGVGGQGVGGVGGLWT